MKHKNSHLLVGYWSRLRNGRSVPDQRDVDPRSIKRLLAQVFILDATEPAAPVYRLSGTSVCERFGAELKGKEFLSHFEEHSAVALAALLKQALNLRQPLCLLSIGATEDNGMVEIETVLTPISCGADGRPDRFLGMMQILGDTAPLLGRTISFQRLVGSQFIREDEGIDEPDVMPPPPRINRDGPNLRLVINRERPATVHFEGDERVASLLEQFGEAFNGNEQLKWMR